jgi:hypothetical protein
MFAVWQLVAVSGVQLLAASMNEIRIGKTAPWAGLAKVSA